MFLLPKILEHLRRPARFLRHLLTDIAGRFVEDRCGQAAASLAFTTLLSLVPLVTVALALFSRLPLFDQAEQVLREFLFSNLLPDKAGRLVGNYLLQFSDKAHRLTLIGSAMIFATAVMTMLTIDHTFNTIWRVEKRRSLGRRIALYGGALVLGPLLAGLAMAAVTFFVSASLGLVNEPPWVRAALYGALPVAFQTVLLALLYGAVPNARVAGGHAFVGGLVAGLGFILMQKLFGTFVAAMPSYRLIYGAFAALPIFLLWLYLSWMVVLLGALLTAALPGALVAMDAPEANAAEPDYIG